MDEDLELRNSLALLLKRAPAPIRAFIINELPGTVGELMSEHGLHVDQAGILETELLLMLVGEQRPEGFVQALQQAGIPPEKVQALTKTVNERVFMKLRESERKAASEPLKVPPPAPRPLVPAPSLVEKHAAAASKEAALPPMPADAFLSPHQEAAVPIYRKPAAAPTPPAYVVNALNAPAAPKQVAPPANLPGQEPAAMPPTAAPKVQQSPIVPPTPIPPAVPFEHHAPTRTMAADMEALKKGADPYRVAHPEPPAWAVLNAPKNTAHTTPHVVESVPAPAAPEAPTMPAASHPTPAAPQETPPVTTYSSDPYREPIE